MKDDPTGIAPFDAFRALVRAGIEAALKHDGYHKRHEGACSYELRLPPVVDWEDAGMPDPMALQPEMQPEHVVKLYCYVLGPARQYEWTDNTQDGVFKKATRDFQSWMREAEAEHAVETGTQGVRN
jgi:hypothetical protein